MEMEQAVVIGLPPSTGVVGRRRSISPHTQTRYPLTPPRQTHGDNLDEGCKAEMACSSPTMLNISSGLAPRLNRQLPKLHPLDTTKLSRMPTDSSPHMIATGTPLESPSITPSPTSCLSDGHEGSVRDHRHVHFADQPATVWRATEGYDRTPHPIIVRLHYLDVLELRELQIDLSIINRRCVQPTPQASHNNSERGSPIPPAPGLSSLSPSQSNQSGRRRVSSLRSDTSDQSRSATSSNDDTLDLPPSPSAWASAFPTSSRLVTRLKEMGDLYPPLPESGMGMTLEPTFGLDGKLDVRSYESYDRAQRGRLGRKNSGEFLVRPSVIRRQTEEEEESEFQRALREAKQELEKRAEQDLKTQLVEERDRLKAKANEMSNRTYEPSQAATNTPFHIRKDSLLSNFPHDRQTLAADFSVTPRSATACLPGASRTKSRGNSIFDSVPTVTGPFARSTPADG